MIANTTHTHTHQAIKPHCQERGTQVIEQACNQQQPQHQQQQQQHTVNGEPLAVLLAGRDADCLAQVAARAKCLDHERVQLIALAALEEELLGPEGLVLGAAIDKREGESLSV